MTDNVGLKEKLGFSFGVLGQNIIYGFFSTYILIFYTDVFGISAAAVGTMFMIARLWDACNDPMMGLIADRTRTKWGKFRPYMLFVPIPIAIITTLTFLTPDISYKSKIIYAYITYIGWGMIYTVGDIPMWALTSAITKDTVERTNVITIARIFSIFGIVIPAIATVPLLKMFGGEFSTRSYPIVAALYGIVCAVLMIGIFFSVRERVVPDKEKRSLRDNANVIIKNKPLILIIISSIITNSILNLRQAILLYYATYNLNNIDLVPILMAATMIAMLIGMLIVPLLISRIGKKNTFIVYGVGIAISSILFYFSGYSSEKHVIIWTLITGIFTGAPAILESAMIADTIEYAEFKTGIRAEGLIFSTQTFMAKFSSALSGGIGGLLLTIIGYVPNVAQTKRALDGLHAMMTIIPAVAVLIGLIPMLFYPLTEKLHKEIVDKLELNKGDIDRGTVFFSK